MWDLISELVCATCCTLLSLWISAASVAKHPCSGLGHALSPGKSEISLVIGKYLCVVQMFQTYKQYLVLNGKVVECEANFACSFR